MLNGKGSKRRPMQITQKQYDRNWRRIFGRNVSTEKNQKKNKTTIDKIAYEWYNFCVGYESPSFYNLLSFRGFDFRQPMAIN